MSPTDYCYFDYYQSENENEPLAIGGYLPLKKVYEFEPVPENLDNEHHEFVIGAQGNVWTEYMKDSKQVEYMVFPRILGLSEVLWRDPSKKDYPDFVNRTSTFFKRLEALQINFANHLYELNGRVINENGKGFFEISGELGGIEKYYTLDGSDPDLSSMKYSGPIPINENLNIKSVVLDESGNALGAVYSQVVNKHKGFLSEAIFNTIPHPSYNTGGIQAVTNGVQGSDKRFGDSEWLGFWGDDLNIVIDLGESIEIDKISTRFFSSKGQWIYPPPMIRVETDQEVMDVIIEESEQNIIEVLASISTKTRYVEITIPNFGIIPAGRQGAGNKAWTFIDEIIIE